MACLWVWDLVSRMAGPGSVLEWLLWQLTGRLWAGGLVGLAARTLRALPGHLRLLRGSGAHLVYVNTINVPLWAPLARVVIGGLLTSTLITLVFVPAMYTLFEEGLGAFRRKPSPDVAAGH